METIALSWLQNVCARLAQLSADTQERAKEHWAKSQKLLQTNRPSGDPSLTVEMAALGKIVFNATIHCSTERVTNIEATITTLVLAEVAKTTQAETA